MVHKPKDHSSESRPVYKPTIRSITPNHFRISQSEDQNQLDRRELKSSLKANFPGQLIEPLEFYKSQEKPLNVRWADDADKSAFKSKFLEKNLSPEEVSTASHQVNTKTQELRMKNLSSERPQQESTTPHTSIRHPF